MFLASVAQGVARSYGKLAWRPIGGYSLPECGADFPKPG
jgi:hypothetical protein